MKTQFTKALHNKPSTQQTEHQFGALNEVTSEAGSPFGPLETGAIADGYSVSLNGYDNQIYSVGRGPSATTVSAPDIEHLY